MDRFLIVLPSGERIDYIVSKLEQETYHGDYFPLFPMIENFIKKHSVETHGARIYEVVERDGKDIYIHLTTFNS